MRDGRFVGVKWVVLAAALVWLAPAPAAARMVTTELTATEVFDALNLLGNGPVGAFTSQGTLTCPGAQPTGDPMQPCPPGSRIRLRGVSGYSRMISSSPLLAGWFYWEMNANFDPSAAGRAWGTFRVELDAGGSWEGTWTNERTKVDDATAWVGRARFVGHGTSGAVQGMLLRFSESATTYTPLPVVWIAAVDARVLAPPARAR